MEKKGKTASILSLIFACFLYGFFPILIRTVGYNIPVFYQNWSRSLLEFVIILLPVIIYKKWIKINPKDVGWMIFRTLGGMLGFLGGYYSFIYLPIGTAYFIFYVGSLVGGFFLGKVIFNEKMTKIKWISLAFGFIGLFFVYSFNVSASQTLSVLAAIGSGFGTSIWNISSKKISNRYSVWQVNLIDIVIYGLIVLFISIYLKEPWSYPTLNSAWIANILFGLILITTGQLMITGFKYVEGQLGSMIMMLEIVFGIIFGFLFYKETISLRTLFGGSLILIALIISQMKVKSSKLKLR